MKNTYQVELYIPRADKWRVMMGSQSINKSFAQGYFSCYKSLAPRPEIRLINISTNEVIENASEKTISCGKDIIKSASDSNN